MNIFRYIVRLLGKYALGSFRLPAPLSWAMLSRDPAAAVQRAILREYLNSGRTSPRLFEMGLALVFWPWKSFAQAWRLTRQVGGQVAVVRSQSAQFLQQIYLAWLHGISPEMYYQMGMATNRSKFSPMAWVQPGHVGLLSRVFREEKVLPEINDKRLFTHLLQKNSVEVAPIFGVVKALQPLEHDAREEIVKKISDQSSLFVKPVRGKGGSGARVFDRLRNGKWRVWQPVSLSEETESEDRPHLSEFDDWELLAALKKTASGDGLLIQPRLENHACLREICGQGLASVRVVSGFGPDGVVILGGVLCFPSPNSITSQQGFTVALDPKSGQLGKVFRSSPDQRFFSYNPANGAVVENVTLPFWTKVLSLVDSAHHVLNEYAFLGWDIAICPDGALILEANGNYGTGAMQKPGPKPLIDEKFLAVFDYWRGRGKAG